MFNLLIDTCVWLDLAQDQKLTPLLRVVETLAREERVRLIVPRVVLDEFKRNRARVAQASARSLKGHFQQVKEAINRTATPAQRKKSILAHLDNVNHRIPIIGGATEGTLGRIETLLAAVPVVEASDAVMLKAAARALNKKAPCHHDNKNSMADAIVIETYFEAAKAGRAGERFAFVTHNRNDFSLANGNQKLPHADLATSFSRIKSMYFILLAECLRRIDPSLVTEVMWEENWEQEPRSLSELLKAEDVLFYQVWYNRHLNLRYSIERGKVKVVSHEEWERRKLNTQRFITEEIWKGAQRAAKRVEKKYGKANLGPWTDFEWGMVNGKLSALRWILGDEWDMLDT